MSDLIKAITGGMARFVLASLMPSVIFLGLFSAYVLPGLPKNVGIFEPAVGVRNDSPAIQVLIFSLCAISASILFAYAATPLYQILEGYRMPRAIRQKLLRKQIKQFRRLEAAKTQYRETAIMPAGYTTDRFVLDYPMDESQVRATRLGNRLTSMEHWSSERYHLDSQTSWYMFIGMASDQMRRDYDEARAPVDFFVSTVLYMTLLGLSGIAVGATRGCPRSRRT